MSHFIPQHSTALLLHNKEVSAKAIDHFLKICQPGRQMKCGLTFSRINIIMISGSVSPAATPQLRNVGLDEEGELRNYIRLALNKRMRRGAIKSIKCGTGTVAEGAYVCAVCER